MSNSNGDHTAANDSLQRFQLRDQVIRGTHTLSLIGDLDMLAAPDLEEAVNGLFAADTKEIVLDLRSVRFIDSFGLRTLLKAHRLSERHGCKFSLIPGSPNVQALFEMTGLAELLPFRADMPPARLPDDALLPKLFAPGNRD